MATLVTTVVTRPLCKNIYIKLRFGIPIHLEAVPVRMREASVPLDAQALSIALRMFRHPWRLGTHCFAEARCLGCDMDTIACNNFLSLCQVRRAWQTASLILSSYPAGARCDVVSYSSVLASSSLWKQPHGVLQQMRRDGILPDTVCMNSFITGIGSWTLAVEVLDHMSMQEELPQTVTYGAALGASLSNWQVAISVFHTASSSRLLDLPSYTSLLAALREGGEWEKALDVLKLVVTDVVCYNAALSACEKSSQWQALLSVFEEMEVRDAVSFATVISSLSRVQRWEDALATFLEIAAPTSSLRVSDECCTSLMSAFARSGQWGGALKLLEEGIS